MKKETKQNTQSTLEEGENNLQNSTNPRFITFEGVEGAGKSTQIPILADRLAKLGIISKITREPGGTAGAEVVRHLILSGTAKTFGPDVEALLFAAARLDHVDQVIKPTLEEGQWVLCDRFTDSTRIYQGEGGADNKIIEELEQLVFRELKPDMTIIIDIPAIKGLERLNSGKGDADLDRFESEELEVQERRRQAFLKLAENEPNRYVVVDGQQKEELVADEIWKSVVKFTES